MFCFRLKYILFILVLILNDCASENVNQDDLQLKFVFIVRIVGKFVPTYLAKINYVQSIQKVTFIIILYL